MNLVMQFRKVCNHPNLFESPEAASPFQFSSLDWSYEVAKDTNTLVVTVRNPVGFHLPRLIYEKGKYLVFSFLYEQVFFHTALIPICALEWNFLCTRSGYTTDFRFLRKTTSPRPYTPYQEEDYLEMNYWSPPLIVGLSCALLTCLRKK